MWRSGRALLFASSLSLTFSLSLLGQGWKRLTQAGEETCHERWWHRHRDASTSLLLPKFAAAALAAAADRVKKSLNLPPFSLPGLLFLFFLYFLVCGWWDFNHVEGKTKGCCWEGAFLYNWCVHQWDLCPLVYLNLCDPGDSHILFTHRALYFFVDRVELASIAGMIMIEKGHWYLTNACWRDIYVCHDPRGTCSSPNWETLGLISLFSWGFVWLHWAHSRFLSAIQLLVNFEGYSSKFSSGYMQSGQLNVFGVHVSSGRWQACVCVRGGRARVRALAWESVFGDLISKSLCVFCRLLEAQHK